MKRFVIALFLVFAFLMRPAQALAADSSVSVTPSVIQSPELTSLALFLQQLGQALVGSGPKNPGVVTFLAGTMDLMFAHPPASSVDYVAYMGNRLRFPGAPTPVYAQGEGGYGYNALQPILPIWTVMRNIAYLAFAVVFIVIGFMIIFRVKIDPKTVTSIQNALPKMIFALILVTFSYAIAGFLIDLMYLLIHIIFAVVVMAGMPQQIKDIAQNYVLGQQSWILGLSGIVPGFITGSFAALGLGVMLVNFFAQPEVVVISTIIGTIVGTIIAGPFGVMLGALGGLTAPVVAPVIVGILGFFIIILMVLWALFKTWLMLLNAYANIILGIIFAPVYLMLEAVPGQSQFWNWLRGMLSNIVAFPAVIGMLLLTMIITAQGSLYGFASSADTLVKTLACGSPQLATLSLVKTICDGITARNLTGGFVPPLIGGNNIATMQALIGLAILLTMPKVVDILQEWFKAPPFKYGGAWMEQLGLAQWGATSYLERRAGQRKIDMQIAAEAAKTSGDWSEVRRYEAVQNLESGIGNVISRIGKK